MYGKKFGLIKLFASDPNCLELEKEGYRVENQIWAASLDLYNPDQLNLFKDRYISTLSRMFEVKEIGPQYLEAVYALKAVNSHSSLHNTGRGNRAPTLPELAKEWKKDTVIFGAFDGQLLIGALETKLEGGRVLLPFCHVDPEWKHLGVATGLTSFAVLYWANEGIRHFAACGSQEIPEREEVLDHLGFNVKDQLRSYVGI